MGFIENNTTYSAEVDLEGLSGDFSVLVYSVPDNSVNLYEMNTLGDYSRYSQKVSMATASASASGVDSWIPTTGVNDTSLLYSFMYYPTSFGLQTMGITFNGYVIVKIDGRNVHQKLDNWASAPETSSFEYNFTESKPYYVEVFSTRIPRTQASMDFGTFSGTVTPADSQFVRAPELFQNLPDILPQKNIFGSGGGKTVACLVVINILVLITVGVGISACVVLKEKTISVYSLINYIQILVLTPMIGYEMPDSVLDLYDGLSVYLMNFNFLGQSVVFTGKRLIF